MRELQRMFFAPRFWALIVGASLLLGLTGPFGTYDSLPLPGRFAYWTATVLATYFAGGATVFLLVQSLWTEGTRQAWHYGAAGAVSGLPVATVVWGINAAVFGTGQGEGIAFLPLLGYCVVIAGLVSMLIAVFTSQYERAASAAATTVAPAAPERPRVVDRLPPAQRGQLTHMSMQDHYVDVRTDRGGGLVLMRFADAVAETDGADGMQIHRSHWVAREAVGNAVRRDGKLFLKLTDGTELPVSRSFQAAVKEAGLLRR
jgi:hypothetical protein